MIRLPGPDSLPERISGRSSPLPAGEPAYDNKTPFIKPLDTGFSFEVEDREILFYRVKPLFPERRWARDASTTMEGTKFQGSKTR
jgi:hypothetical protein